MPLNINGFVVPETYEMKFNGDNVERVVYNGQEVWKQNVPIPCGVKTQAVSVSNTFNQFSQDCDYYNGYIVVAGASSMEGYLLVWDFENQVLVGNRLQMPNRPHANVVNFTDVKFSEDDFFPMLFVESEGGATEGFSAVCYLYRLEGNDPSNLTISLVMSVKAENATFFAGYDRKDGCITFWQKESETIPYRYRYKKYKYFSLLSNEPEKVLMDEDVSFVTEWRDAPHFYIQGCYLHDDCVYQVWGLSGDNWLTMTHLKSPAMYIVPLDDIVFKGEPEGIFLKDGDIYMIAYSDTNLYKVTPVWKNKLEYPSYLRMDANQYISYRSGAVIAYNNSTYPGNSYLKAEFRIRDETSKNQSKMFCGVRQGTGKNFYFCYNPAQGKVFGEFVASAGNLMMSPIDKEDFHTYEILPKEDNAGAELHLDGDSVSIAETNGTLNITYAFGINVFGTGFTAVDNRGCVTDFKMIEYKVFTRTIGDLTFITSRIKHLIPAVYDGVVGAFDTDACIFYPYTSTTPPTAVYE